MLMLGALFTAINPVRLGIIALLISRPRPMPNLFAYWVGAVVSGIPLLLIPLWVLHSTPVLEDFTQGLTTSPTFRQIQVGLGVLALSIAVFMVVRSWSRRKMSPLKTGGKKPTGALNPEPPNSIAKLLGQGEVPSKRRVLGRFRNAWENGSLWVAGVLGVITGAPSLDGIILVTAIILASGVAIGTQVIAAITFVLAMLVIVEFILISALVAPTRTHAVLQVLHDRVQMHRQKIVIGLIALVGAALTAQGSGVM